MSLMTTTRGWPLKSSTWDGGIACATTGRWALGRRRTRHTSPDKCFLPRRLIVWCFGSSMGTHDSLYDNQSVEQDENDLGSGLSGVDAKSLLIASMIVFRIVVRSRANRKQSSVANVLL